MNKIKTLTLGSLLLSLTGVASAGVVPIGEQITNGNFTTNLSGWTTSGTANRRLATDAINTATGNAGFKNDNGTSFFNSAFAVLGDVSGNIAGNPTSGISSISQSFTLPLMQGSFSVSSYELTIRFLTVFDGDDSSSAVSDSPFKDVFSVTLTSLSNPLLSWTSGPLPDCGPLATCPNNQLFYDSHIPPPPNPLPDPPIVRSNLLPGTYTLTFILNEKAGTGANLTNTAAGIDTVSITGRAFTIPQPSILLLFGAGLLALRLARKPA